MVFSEDESLVLFQGYVSTFWNLAISNLFLSGLTLLTIYLTYRLVTFTEVVKVSSLQKKYFFVINL